MRKHIIKITNILICMVITMCIGVELVSASSIKASSTKIKPGDKITLMISNLTSSDSKYKLSYDDKYFSSEGSTCGSGKTILTEKAKGSASCEINLKAKSQDLTGDVASVISIVSEGESDKSELSITIQANKTTTTTTSPTTTTTTSSTTPQKSNNAFLSSIKISDDKGTSIGYTPTFNKEVYDYSATVASTVSKVSIDTTLEDSKANVVITGNNTELVAGENNKIVITVTAEDGTKKTYNINVKRESQDSNANLSSLEIKEDKTFEFDPDSFVYDINIKNSVNKLTINYSVESDTTTVEISGNKKLKNGSVVKILVTAEDGTKREYTLNIIKEKDTVKTTDTTKYKDEKNPFVLIVLSVIGFALIGGIINVIKK